MDLVGLLQVKPPNFSSAGLPSFSTYPKTGSSLSDSRDALNWEASGHSSTWSTFFWGGHAVFADVDTAYLPNWSRSLGHSIAIVGYDDSAGTYAYVDTCGHRCNGSTQSTDGGVWHVSQSRMYQAIVALGAGYAR
ncbi:MAG TPA: hypothetical protein VH165_17890 [Kofleriaceae bacterium]|nr:hypothetical protein [Kofleriaceae bacterium]